MHSSDTSAVPVATDSLAAEPVGAHAEAAGEAGGLNTNTSASLSTGLLKTALSLGLLVFLLTRVDLRATAEAFTGARWGYLVAALALYLAGVPLRAYRWQGLLLALHVAIPLRRLVSLYFVGTFFNNILPTGVGGDVVRAYELSKDGAGAAAAASTVLVDRAAGLLVLLAIALISTVFSFRMIDLNLALVIAGISLGSFAGVAVLLWDDLWRKVARVLPGARRLLARRGLEAFYRSLQVYRGRAVVQALVLSFVFNVVLIAVNYLIALSMGVNISLWYFLLFIPLISFSLILPVSVSGLGVREGTYVLLFGQAGVAAPLALAMSLAFYALNVATGLIGGVIYAFQGLGWWTSSSGRG